MGAVPVRRGTRRSVVPGVTTTGASSAGSTSGAVNARHAGRVPPPTTGRPTTPPPRERITKRQKKRLALASGPSRIVSAATVSLTRTRFPSTSVPPIVPTAPVLTRTPARSAVRSWPRIAYSPSSGWQRDRSGATATLARPRTATARMRRGAIPLLPRPGAVELPQRRLARHDRERRGRPVAAQHARQDRQRAHEEARIGEQPLRRLQHVEDAHERPEDDGVHAARRQQALIEEPAERLLGDVREPRQRIGHLPGWDLAERPAVSGDGRLPERVELALALPVEEARRGAHVARVAAERLVQQGGLDDRRGGAPAVDRVRVVGRIADGEEARGERTLAVDEPPQPVAEVSHHQDGCRRAVDRHRDAPRAPGRDGGKRPHERLEAGGFREPPERAVVDRRADADRERRVVTREDRDLDPPEVARDETGRAPWRPSVAAAVEACVVEGAGIRAELARQRRADRPEPGRRPRPSTGGVDHQRGAHHAAIGQANTRDRGTSPVARRDRQAGDRHAFAQLDTRPPAHALAERPFEGRAPAGEEDHLVVAVLRRDSQRGARPLGEVP